MNVSLPNVKCLQWAVLTLCGAMSLQAMSVPPATVPTANVVAVPGHPLAPLSELYSVHAGGLAVEVKEERYDFDVAMFTMGESPVVVEITVEDDFETFSLKPDRFGVEVERIQNTLRFTLAEPHKLVLQLPDQRPLALIATPLETEIPQPGDPDVIYFKPGVTDAGVIQPEDGQTIYFAPGAVVKGRIEAHGVEGVRVLGRGLLETEGYSIRDQKLHGILFDRCKNIYVEGIGVRSYDTWWQTLFLNTIDAEVAHVNLFGIGVNTDGVDVDAVKNFLVRDSFIRCEDDGLGWHALDAEANGEMITENVVADNLVIWNTKWGNGIRIGASMEAQLWRNITIRNVDILMHAKSGLRSDYSDWAWMDNLRFENITIEKPSVAINFVIGETRYSNSTGYLKQRGHIHGLLFENVKLSGGGIYLIGADAKHRIHSVWFNNCTKAGKLIDSTEDVKANPHVTNIHFNEPFQPIDRESAPGVYELEDYESTVSEGAQYLVAEPSASLGRFRAFVPKREGAYIEHTIPVEAPGQYRLLLLLRTSSGHGQLELSLNGEVLVPEERLSLDDASFQVLDCGLVQFEQAGPQKFRVMLPDFDDGAGGRIELDALRLEEQ